MSPQLMGGIFGGLDGYLGITPQGYRCPTCGCPHHMAMQQQQAMLGQQNNLMGLLGGGLQGMHNAARADDDRRRRLRHIATMEQAAYWHAWERDREWLRRK